MTTATRQVLVPFARRYDRVGRPLGKIRLRPAPHALSIAEVTARHEAERQEQGR